MSKTKSGFEYSVDPRVLTDWRFTMAITKIQTGKDLEKLSAMYEIAGLLLGDGYDALMDHVRERNDGFVPVEAVMIEITEILEGAKELKN